MPRTDLQPASLCLSARGRSMITYLMPISGGALSTWRLLCSTSTCIASTMTSLPVARTRGRLFDRFGFSVLVALTIVSALFAPLVFLGNFWRALVGAAIWGLGMGVHESIIPAAVAPMVSTRRLASAFGTFTAGYGLFWFLGS